MAKNKKHRIKYQREVTILKDVHREYGTGLGRSNATGFPILYHYEAAKECYAIAMERLGYSLKDIRDDICRKFSLKNTIMIGMQLVTN